MEQGKAHRSSRLAIPGVLLIVLSALQAQGLTIVDYPGSTRTSILGINTAGIVVGFYKDSSDIDHAFQFDGTTYVNIDFPDAISSRATGIDNAARIVGTYQDAMTVHGFLLEAGTYTTIDYAPGPGHSTVVRGINDVGQMVGTYTAVPPIQIRAFLREPDGTFTIIPTPGRYSSASGINNAGQIVGNYIGLVVGSHGFLMDGGTFTNIDAPGGFIAYPVGLNGNASPVVAGSYHTAPEIYHGFATTVGTTFCTIDMPGSTSTALNAIDSSDAGGTCGWQLMAGHFDVDATSHGFYFSPEDLPLLSVQCVSAP